MYVYYDRLLDMLVFLLFTLFPGQKWSQSNSMWEERGVNDVAAQKPNQTSRFTLKDIKKINNNF